MNNNIINIMALAVAVNNKDAAGITSVIEKLNGVELSISEKESLRLYEDTLINISVENKDIQTFKKDWFDYFSANMPELSQKLNDGGALTDEDKETLSNALTKFKG